MRQENFDFLINNLTNSVNINVTIPWQVALSFSGSRNLHSTQTLYKHANVSAMHENITGWLWPLHHSVFSD